MEVSDGAGTKFVDTPDFFLTQKWIIKTLLALPAALARFVSATKENSSQCLVLRTTADSQVGFRRWRVNGRLLGKPLGTVQVEPGNQGAVLILKKDSRDTWKFRRWTHQAATVLTGAGFYWWIWRVSNSPLESCPPDVLSIKKEHLIKLHQRRGQVRRGALATFPFLLVDSIIVA